MKSLSLLAGRTVGMWSIFNNSFVLKTETPYGTNNQIMSLCIKELFGAILIYPQPVKNQGNGDKLNRPFVGMQI